MLKSISSISAPSNYMSKKIMLDKEDDFNNNDFKIFIEGKLNSSR